MKRLCMLGLASVGLLAIPSMIAVASPPAAETQFWSGEYTVPCGDYDITDSWYGNVNITYYWNPDGSLDRYHIHGEFVDHMTNPKNGKSATGRTQGYNFFEDLDDAPGVWKHAGLMFHVTLPGQGVVVIDAGYMIMYDGQITYMKGNHQFNGGELDKLCAALR